jgi:hypothetical protein
MALIITHATVASDPQTPLLGADDWNADHVFSGTIEQDQNNVAVDGVTITGDGTPSNPLTASGGSSSISGNAIVDFGAYGYATKVSVVDALVMATTKIMVSLASPAAGRDDDELEFNPICVAAIAKNGVGFDIYATAPIGADGQFNVNYMIGAY